jgi:SAM-dependent methyltransferase
MPQPMPQTNAQQIEFWNGPTAQRWTRLQRQLDQYLRPFADAVIARLAPRPGERIVDLGCGAGDTTLALADRVQGHGMVLGIDISRPMLQRATARAANTPEYPIRFIEADAAFHAFEPGAWDAAFSRFGVMFFADPVAAFANIRRALKPGGRLAFCCWRDRRENAWVRLPVAAARAHLAELPPAPGPEEPGPFAFADADRLRRILGGAGFTDIAIDRFDPSLVYPGTAADAARFLSEMGPIGSVLQDHPQAVRDAVVETLTGLLADTSEAGTVRLAASTWLVGARNP